MQVRSLNFFLICYVIVLTLLPIVMAFNKDGFNYYKDYLRGKNDEVENLADPMGEKILYFYRTPLQLGMPDNRRFLDVEFGKRAANKFKNYMLGKQSNLEDADDIAVQKKSGKWTLAWMLNNVQRLGEGVN